MLALLTLILNSMLCQSFLRSIKLYISFVLLQYGSTNVLVRSTKFEFGCGKGVKRVMFATPFSLLKQLNLNMDFTLFSRL